MSIIEIENRRRRLVDRVRQNASASSQWLELVSFFKQVQQQPEQHRFQSYYLEFAPLCIRMANAPLLHNKNPHLLEIHLQILHDCRLWVCQPDLEKKIGTAENRLKTLIAQSYLYAGDAVSACRILNWEIAQIAGANELATALKLVDCAAVKRLPLAVEMKSMIYSWREAVARFSAENLQVLLVENNEPNQDVQGRVLTLNLHCRDRHQDGDEDIVNINNSTPIGQFSPYYSMVDAVRAAKCLVFSTQDRKTCYLYHYSFSDKAAEFSGDSIGLAAGLLAFAGRHNHHYRRPVVRLANRAAVTGSLAPDGRVVGVDEHALAAKLEAAFFSPLQRVYVPPDNLLNAMTMVNGLKSIYPHRFLELIGVHTLQKALQDKNLVQITRPSPAGRVLAAGKRMRHKAPILTTLIGFLLILLFSQIHALQWWRRPTPTAWKVNARQFMMYDQYGEKLWSVDFPFDLNSLSFSSNRVIIDDLDGDGTKEAVVGIEAFAHSKYSGGIYCFSQDGRALWPTLKFGRSLYTKSNLFIPDHYYVGEIKTATLFADGKKTIIVTIGHFDEFVSLIALIDPAGTILGEYWNSGFIATFTTMDINQDSIKELILGPYDNETGRARLTILDPRNMHGASPQQDEHYMLRDLDPGTQIACLRFPPSPFCKKQGLRDVIIKIESVDQNFKVDIGNAWEKPDLSPTEQPGMYNYTFTPGLDLLYTAVPDHFSNRFRKIIGREFTTKEQKELEKVEYWRGGNGWL